MVAVTAFPRVVGKQLQSPLASADEAKRGQGKEEEKRNGMKN